MRQDAKVFKLNVKQLHRRNACLKSSVVAPDGPVVSLTTFGGRLHTVYLSIESIAAGNLLPSQLILWLQDRNTYNNRPDSIRRLEDRGLDVRLTDNYGPHSKYYPYLLSKNEFSGPLVTADDDVLYSSWWLAGLSHAHDLNSHVVSCYRAYTMQFAREAIAPYAAWLPCTTTEPDVRNFATGGSGCIYPAKLLTELKAADQEFMQLCPKADDVWLHANALRAGFKVQQISNRPLNFSTIPGTQTGALFTVNASQGGNDEQIRATYTAHDLDVLMSQGNRRGYEAKQNSSRISMTTEEQ
jgi:hypothetical protein